MKKGFVKKTVFGLVFLATMISVISGAFMGGRAFAEPVSETNEASTGAASQDNCKNAFGGISFAICGLAERGGNVLDYGYEWLDRIEDFSILKPTDLGDASPVRLIWQKMTDIAGTVPIIMIIVVIICQIFGIGNYAIKAVFSKLIMVPILMSLSFSGCAVLADLSNILGSAIGNIFKSVEETVGISDSLSFSAVWQALVGGGAITVGGIAIFMAASAHTVTSLFFAMVPIILGGIAAIVVGLFTVALRNVVVMALTIASPVALVSLLLPAFFGRMNSLFRWWRVTFMQMLIFYPSFSALRGTAHLAGATIIASASDGFWLIIGIAVQILPLFLSWKLLHMSGTVLGMVSSTMKGWTNPALRGVQGWAASHSELAKSKGLAKDKPMLPMTRLRQWLSDRRVYRTEETLANYGSAHGRGVAYSAKKNKNKDGKATNLGIERYKRMIMNKENESIVKENSMFFADGIQGLYRERHFLNRTISNKEDLVELDNRAIKAFDEGFLLDRQYENIEYSNQRSRFKRFQDAQLAHLDANLPNKTEKGSTPHKSFRGSEAERRTAEERYERIKSIMGDEAGVGYAYGYAAQQFTLARNVRQGATYTGATLLPNTRDIVASLNEMSKKGNARDYIDDIVSGIMVLNDRGDTDLIKDQVINILNSEKGVLKGSYAAQTLSNVLRTVKKDPMLLATQKIINLEGAAYASGESGKEELDFKDLFLGYYEDENGKKHYAKHGGILKTMAGMSFTGIERTVLKSIQQSIEEYSKDENGNRDIKKESELRDRFFDSNMPAIISAINAEPSGSDAMNALVSFVTGYNKKVNPDDGKVGLKSVWDDEKDTDRQNKLKEMYGSNTMKWLSSQTAAQLAGIRTDMRDPMFANLMWMYMNGSIDVSSWTSDMQNERTELINNYNNTSDADLRKKIGQKMANVELRNLLLKNGAMDMLAFMNYNGGLAATKPWFKTMLGAGPYDRDAVTNLKTVINSSGSNVDAWLKSAKIELHKAFGSNSMIEHMLDMYSQAPGVTVPLLNQYLSSMLDFTA
ncbi:MAG: DMT family transporter [Candidatus Saccharibacteria bacterium]|nr:DMT family transporter [Candidatus Saccharibacteria bacterium]